MFLTVIVRTNDNPRTAWKNKWDILGVRLADGIWGGKEQEVHQVVRIDHTDPTISPQDRQAFAAIEVKLNAKKRAGDSNPALAIPFADGDRVQSTVFFDLDLLPPAQRQRVQDRQFKEPPISHLTARGLIKRR